MQLFYCSTIIDGENYLSQEESRHCTKVLRKKSGDLIQITDGLGNHYEGELTDVNPKKCGFKITSIKFRKKPYYSIHIAIAPTKNLDRIEWFVEKAVEIGIDKITFIQTAFSERKHIKINRIKKKAISAMKQSVRVYLPEISEMVNLNAFLKTAQGDQKFVAHLEGDETKHLLDEAKASQNYVILIGPEGGFSDDEISKIKENDFDIVKIADYRLRTETAGVVACATLNDINYHK